MEIFGQSTGDRWSEPIYWQEDSHVKMFRTQVAESGSRVIVQDSGSNLVGRFARYNPASCSWRTCQGSFIEASPEYSEIWPDSGIVLSGHAYQRAPLVLHIHGKDCSLWPTPRASGRDNCGGANARRKAQRNGVYIGRNQNPQLTEWLMGFPIGWTDLQPSETPSFRKSPNTSAGASSPQKEHRDELGHERG